MGSNKAVASTALLLALNLLLFSMVNADTCPANSKFLQCAPVLLSKSYYQPCCSLINGLVDLDAAVCLCAALKADILGIIELDLDVAFRLILTTACAKTLPSGFKCKK